VETIITPYLPKSGRKDKMDKILWIGFFDNFDGGENFLHFVSSKDYHKAEADFFKHYKEAMGEKLDKSGLKDLIHLEFSSDLKQEYRVKLEAVK
jgi:hypothetical protein